jgi:chromate transport protein ChrA
VLKVNSGIKSFANVNAQILLNVQHLTNGMKIYANAIVVLSVYLLSQNALQSVGSNLIANVYLLVNKT